MNGKNNKIPCTVQVLTLNCGHILRRCLESLVDFDEILVCDGNSTDNTIEIAKEFGARIIKQTDSNKLNYRIKDFAEMRNKCIRAGKYDWNLYIDSDEMLPKRTAEEIRKIVTSPIKHYIYNVPNKILYEGREIKYAVPYPGYQMRFFNRKSGAYHVRTPHSRLHFDENEYPVGYLNNPWYVIIEDPHINKGHVQIEAEKSTAMPFGHFLYWIVWKKSFGIVKNLISTGLLYVRHGFKETLPPSVELLRIQYKWLLLTSAIKLRFKGKAVR